MMMKREPNEPPVPHMSAAEFRKHGRAMIDWIADYLESRVEEFPVLSQVEPGTVRAQLPATAPEHGESFDALMRDVERVIMPGLTHWQSPSFFGFFPANVSYPAILGELLSAGLGVQGMLWATSPACTEVESHVLDWLVQMLELPQGFRSIPSPQTPLPEGEGLQGGGVIQDTASSATLCAMIAARERATTCESNARGVRQQLIAYTSNQSHSSVEKAVKICGIGSDNLRLIDVDDNFAMKPEALARAIEADRAKGMIPFFVCATVGTTSSNAVDPVRVIGEVITGASSDGERRALTPGPSRLLSTASLRHGDSSTAGRGEKIWLHVDAAMSGTAALCPEFRWIHDGLEYADSYCFNPHKWMLTNFDCNCFWVRDRAALIRALSVLPEYLKNTATESGAVFDYRDWQIPLGRRFRALKLWFVIRHYGVEGLRAHVRHGVQLARWFSEQVKQHPEFEVAAPVPLNLVCFRHVGGDEVNQRIIDQVNRSGKAYLTHTRLNERLTLRMAIGGTRTKREHVERAWELICDCAR